MKSANELWIDMLNAERKFWERVYLQALERSDDWDIAFADADRAVELRREMMRAQSEYYSLEGLVVG